jgi:hypothetical protein
MACQPRWRRESAVNKAVPGYRGQIMKWMMLLGGFFLYAVAATAGVGALMLSLMRSSYGGIFVMFAAPVIGMLCGLVGLRFGYLVYKKDYYSAVGITVVLAFSVGIVVLGVFS